MPEPIAITESSPLPSIRVWLGPLPRSVTALEISNAPDRKGVPPAGICSS